MMYREDLVEAKGKVKTYWISPSSNASSTRTDNEDEYESEIKDDRFIDWNTKVLP